MGYGLRREHDGSPPVFLGHPVVAGDRAGGADLVAQGAAPGDLQVVGAVDASPILWAATDEVFGNGHGAHAGHGASEFSVEVAPVASGEIATIAPAELPKGSVITTSGRISGVTEPGDVSVHYPFPINDLVTLDDALTYGSRAAGARFAVYIGDLGSDTAARAREILAKVPTPNNAVLVAVSPDQHAIEVVYGSQVRGRGAESAARWASPLRRRPFRRAS